MEISYVIEYKSDALADIAFWKKSGDRAIQRRISELVTDMEQHPFSGKGKPEALRFELAGLWSRRINLEHRIIYEVTDHTISILSLRGHYMKK